MGHSTLVLLDRGYAAALVRNQKRERQHCGRQSDSDVAISPRDVVSGPANIQGSRARRDLFAGTSEDNDYHHMEQLLREYNQHVSRPGTPKLRLKIVNYKFFFRLDFYEREMLIVNSEKVSTREIYVI